MDFGPKQSDWLINQLGNPSFEELPSCFGAIDLSAMQQERSWCPPHRQGHSSMRHAKDILSWLGHHLLLRQRARGAGRG